MKKINSRFKKESIKNYLLQDDQSLLFNTVLDDENSYLKTTVIKKYNAFKLLKNREIPIKKIKHCIKSKIIYILSNIIIFLLLILYHYQKKQFNIPSDVEAVFNSIAIKKELTIPDIVIHRVLKEIEVFEKEKHFLDNDVTLNNLAKRFNTNSRYLSKIINSHMNKNFSSYISDLRIDYVIEILKKQSKLRKYTIKGIAFEVGFKNAESFTNAFYKKTKIYPSHFIKELQKTKDPYF